MSKFFSKYGAKLFFCVACLLLIASITFSAYSFAGFVSRVDKSDNGAFVATMDCKVDIDGELDSFINAPYIQKIGENASAIRMNSWSESVVTVSNVGTHGLDYLYSFVFYMPKDFALSAMFQLVELDSARNAVNASKICRIGDDGNSITEADYTAATDGDIAVKIENEYQSMIDEGKELALEQCSAVLQKHKRTVALKRTYATYYLMDDVQYFVCPVSFVETAELEYYRVTLNIASDGDNYVLHDGESHSFMLRLVPRKALSEGVNHEWNADEYFVKDGESGGYTECLSEPVSGNSEYDFKWQWTKGDSETPKISVRSVGDSDDSWHEVLVESNVGMTNPTIISAVFTQVQS